jgi:hypothetical protein
VTEPRRPWPPSRPLLHHDRPSRLFEVLAALGGVVLVVVALLLLVWAVLGPVSWP